MLTQDCWSARICWIGTSLVRDAGTLLGENAGSLQITWIYRKLAKFDLVFCSFNSESHFLGAQFSICFKGKTEKV